MARTTDTPAADTERKKRKRGAVLKFSLAGVALLGIGAAATSAQWSNDAWFSATATAATVELKGVVTDTATDVVSTDPGWVVADTDGSLVVDSSKFGNLLPGQTRTVYLHVLNAGSTTLAVTNPTYTVSNPTYFAKGAATTATAGVTLATTPTSLASGAQQAVKLEITTNSAWVTTAQGQTSVIKVQFNGAA